MDLVAQMANTGALINDMVANLGKKLLELNVIKTEELYCVGRERVVNTYQLF